MSKARTTIAAIVAFAMALVGFVGGAGVAMAAELTNVVTGMSVVQTASSVNGSVDVDGTFAIPNGSAAGDYFTVVLPDQFKAGTLDFYLCDTSSPCTASSTDAVAHAVQSGKTVTFTLTSYVQSHSNVTGSFTFSELWDKTEVTTSGVQYLTFVAGANTFTDEVDVNVPPDPIGNPVNGYKIWIYHEAADGNPAYLEGYLRTPNAGGDGTVTIVDTPSAGVSIDCSSVTVVLAQFIDGAWNYVRDVDPEDLTVTCSETELSIEVRNVQEGYSVQGHFLASPPADQSITSIGNTAVFTWPVGRTFTDTQYAERITGGGSGEGDAAVSVGNYVWDDTNHNGIQDAGEPGIDGVSLTVSRSDGAAVTDSAGAAYPSTSTTTAGGGLYLFDDLAVLPAGTHYVVTIDNATVPPGYVPTLTGQGTVADDSSTGSATSTDLTTDGESDLTLDFGFWEPTPEISVVKGDSDGNTGDDSGDPVVLDDGTTGLVITVTNTGTEALKDITVTDATTGSGAVTNLVCTFPDDSTGTTWAGPLDVGESFPCAGTLTGVTSVQHQDTITVTGTGVVSLDGVTDDDPYNAVRGAVSVGNYVWLDTNHNGIQNAGEPGISGVTLTLTGPDGQPVTDIDGNPVGPTTTDVDGLYEFTDLPILDQGQHYTVTVTDPAGYLPTLTGQGTLATDSSTGSASSVGLTADGDSDMTLDFGFWEPTPEISVVKGDIDGNTGDDSTDPVVLNDGTTELVITVTNTGTEPLKDITVTDAATGSGTVTGLVCTFPDDSMGTTWAGPLAVGESFPCAATLTGVTSVAHQDTITVTGTGTVTLDGVTDDNPYNAVRGAVSVGNYVWLDTNHNGIQNAGEPGISGVTVTLTGPGGHPVTDVNGNPVGPVVTDADGLYEFTDLPILNQGQQYTVTIDSETVPVGLYPTLTGQGTLATDSSTGSASSVGLTADGDSDMTLDFGFWEPEPAITIVKGDIDGNAADVPADVVDLGYAPAGTTLEFTVTNTGTEALEDITVTDTVVANGTVTGLVCTFPDESTGTTWAGPLAVGVSFDCTATLSGVAAGSMLHLDNATVEGTGVVSGYPVSDENPYYASAIAPVSVGDLVWLDTNHNGIQDPGEPGIPNVTITITDLAGHPVTDVNGDPVAPVVTDANGIYLFANLPAGQYVTHVDTATVPAGLFPTVPGAGTSATDSSTDSATSTVLEPGDSDMTLDYGFWQPAPTIAVVKGDSDGNTGDDSTDPVVLNDGTTDLVITVTNTGTEPLKDITVTDATTGSGMVTGLVCTFPDESTGTTWAGPLAVGASFPCAATLTGVTSVQHQDTITVTGTGTVSLQGVTDDNPYNAVRGSVSVGNYVWFDTNHNGIQNAGEPGISGVVLTLTGPDGEAVIDVDGNPVSATLTDADGLYGFTNLPILEQGQHYTVTITRPAGYKPTLTGKGTPATDSSTGYANSGELTVDGEADMTLDFGFVKATSGSDDDSGKTSDDDSSGGTVNSGDPLSSARSARIAWAGAVLMLFAMASLWLILATRYRGPRRRF